MRKVLHPRSVHNLSYTMMCLHTILSQSFIGAIVLLVVVHAMPTDPSKLKAAAPVPLGVINPPKKDLWWPLLDQTVRVH
ncbi:MAG: hypothetical protein NXY57DRAFT_1013598 [Lentinula lateritia]|nr:MAG: hypothetical protein NXY57DRAFT_1013598 [Lentinula lateritia]